MTQSEITAALDEWQAVMQPLETKLDALHKLINSPDGPLMQSIHALQEYTVKQLAERINYDADTLSDWWLVNDFGRRAPMRIGFSGEPMREISTNEALAGFIAECHSRSAS